jgi:hypothetical protein
MSKRPLQFPTSIVPASPKRSWYAIPYFSRYELSIPQLEVRDLGWKEMYPNGAILPTKIASLPVARKGEHYTRMIADDGIIYKSYINDLYDLVVQDNNKGNNQEKFNRRPDQLPLSFKPVGSNNYKKKDSEVKKYWKEVEYYAYTK